MQLALLTRCVTCLRYNASFILDGHACFRHSSLAILPGEVGRAFAVTRERIRQIEAKALRKLRQPSRSGKLRLFLDDVHE
jgi:hypothetical protein